MEDETYSGMRTYGGGRQYRGIENFNIKGKKRKEEIQK